MPCASNKEGASGLVVYDSGYGSGQLIISELSQEVQSILTLLETSEQRRACSDDSVRHSARPIDSRQYSRQHAAPHRTDGAPRVVCPGALRLARRLGARHARDVLIEETG